MKRLYTILVCLIPLLLFSQDEDSLLIRGIFDEALSSRIAYENLEWLCRNTEGRIAGTPEAAAAVEFTLDGSG